MTINNIEVKELQEIQTAAFAHVGSYSEICGAFQKLMAWATPKGLLTGKPKIIGVYHDCPASKPVEQLRSDACVEVDNDMEVSGEARRYTVSGGKYVVVNMAITMSEFCEAWGKVYDIVAEKGLECDYRDHYELYLNDPADDPNGVWVVDICVPVK